MRPIAWVLLTTALALAPGCSLGADKAKVAEDERPIGIATMREDGTIVLQLRAEDDQGVRMGDASFQYPPTHPRYKEILDHIEGLRPGESKPVPAWPKKESE
jgi:hypothetical protein